MDTPDPERWITLAHVLYHFKGLGPIEDKEPTKKTNQKGKTYYSIDFVVEGTHKKVASWVYCKFDNFETVWCLKKSLQDQALNYNQEYAYCYVDDTAAVKKAVEAIMADTNEEIHGVDWRD